jgi:hypothetical protein
LSEGAEAGGTPSPPAWVRTRAKVDLIPDKHQEASYQASSSLVPPPTRRGSTSLTGNGPPRRTRDGNAAAEFCKEVDGKEGQTVSVAQGVQQGKRRKQGGR